MHAKQTDCKAQQQAQADVVYGASTRAYLVCLPPCSQASFAALAPWGVVALLCLGLIETYRLAALWDEEDFEKRAYPGASLCYSYMVQVRAMNTL